MFRSPRRVILAGLIIAAIGALTSVSWDGVPAEKQDAPIKVRFLGRDATTGARPGLFAKMRLRLQFDNLADEPRWIVTTLDRETKLKTKFTPNAEADLPFFALRSAGADGKQVVLVSFIGEPQFTAIRLPAKSKVVVDDFELPADADVAELDWAEAKSIDIVVGERKPAPLETWMNLPLTSAAGNVVRGASWSDALRDENGTLDAKIPKDKITRIDIEPIRRGRLAVEGYEARGRFYAQAQRPKSEPIGGWRLVQRYRPTQPLKVDELDFSPDGSMLAVSLQTFKVLALDLEKGLEKLYPGSETARARFFAFSKDGHLLVKTVNADKLTVADDWTAGKEAAHLRDATDKTIVGNDHVASPTGDRVVVTSPGIFQVWEFAKFDAVKLARPEKDVAFVYRSGAFSPDGKRFAAGFENAKLGGKVYVWDLIPGVGDKRESAMPPRDVFTERQTGIHYLAFSADGNTLIGTGKQASAIWVWHLDSGKEFAIRHQRSLPNFHALALSPDGKIAAIAATPFASDIPIPPLFLSDTSDGKTLAELTGLKAPIHAVTFSRDGRRIAAGDSEGLIQVWQRD